MFNDYPEKIFIFDVNRTLDCAFYEPGDFVLPTKAVFYALKSLPNTWVGTWSGMYPWMQLQKLVRVGVRPDFVIAKHDGNAFRDSIISIYKKDTTKYYVIGNDEEDRLFAYNFHFDYHDHRRFFEMFEKGLLIDSYQDLLYPDRIVEGFRGTSKTWDKIKDKVDFNGRTVLDIGCSTGYFTIQSLRNGASKTYSVDLNELHNVTKLPNTFQKPLSVAEGLLKLWGFDDSKYSLTECDWETCECLPNKIDVVFCMHVAHYWKDMEKGLCKLFELKPETVVFEIDLNDMIKSVFERYGYKIDFNEKSHWNGKDTLIVRKK
jgi:SAM-dependent methyltransferase